METTAVTLAALMGMLGTGIGGLVSPRKGRWQGMLGLATAGMMLTIAAVELLPEAMELSGQWVGFLCFALGVAFVVLLTALLPHGERGTGWLLLLSLALHNLPEGMSIGAGFSAAPELGMKTAMVVGLHVIPEGMALGSMLRRQGRPRWQIVLLCAMTGSPMALGAMVGQQMAVTALGVGGCLALAAGAIVFVAAQEVLPEGYDDGSRPRLPGLWVALGFVLALAGLILM